MFILFFLFISCDKGSKSEFSSDDFNLFPSARHTSMFLRDGLYERDNETDELETTSNDVNTVENGESPSISETPNSPNRNSIDFFDRDAIPSVKHTGVSSDSESPLSRFLYIVEIKLQKTSTRLQKFWNSFSNIFVEKADPKKATDFDKHIDLLINYFDNEDKKNNFLNSIAHLRKPYSNEYIDYASKKNAYQLFLLEIQGSNISEENKIIAKTIEKILDITTGEDFDQVATLFLNLSIDKKESEENLKKRLKRLGDIFELVFKKPT